jgi:hypothetical protein
MADERELLDRLQSAYEVIGRLRYELHVLVGRPRSDYAAHPNEVVAFIRDAMPHGATVEGADAALPSDDEDGDWEGVNPDAEFQAGQRVRLVEGLRDQPLFGTVLRHGQSPPGADVPTCVNVTMPDGSESEMWVYESGLELDIPPPETV